MSRKNILKYFNKRVDSIISFLEKGEQKLSAEDFHQLRVEIKKVKAVFSLADFSVKRFKRKKLFQPFKEVFKRAGKIRQLQLEASMLKRLNLYPKLKAHTGALEKSLGKQKEKLFSLEATRPQEQLKHNYRRVKPFLKRIGKKEAAEFLKQNEKDILKVAESKKIQPEQIHELRKKLKRFYYISKLFSLKSSRLENIDSFQELLGTWHDQVVMERQLQNVIEKGKGSSSEIRRIKILEGKIAGKAEKLLGEIEKKRFEL